MSDFPSQDLSDYLVIFVMLFDGMKTREREAGRARGLVGAATREEAVDNVGGDDAAPCMNLGPNLQQNNNMRQLDRK